MNPKIFLIFISSEGLLTHNIFKTQSHTRKCFLTSMPKPFKEISYQQLDY